GIWREPDCVVGFFLVKELHCQDTPGAYLAPIARVGFVHDAKPVALAEVLHEVNLAAQDLDHLKGDVIGYPGRVSGTEQGALDFAFSDTNLCVRDLLLFSGGKAAVPV